MFDRRSNIINNQSFMFPVKWWSFSIGKYAATKTKSVKPTYINLLSCDNSEYHNEHHSKRMSSHLFGSITSRHGWKVIESSMAGPAPSCLDLTISIRPGWNYFLNKIKWFTLSDSTGHLSQVHNHASRRDDAASDMTRISREGFFARKMLLI